MDDKPLTHKELWQQAEGLLRQVNRECRAMSRDIHDLRAELAAIRESARWIPVEEDVPADCEDVLVWNGEPRQGWLDTDSGWFKDSSGNRLYNVTHWRPMPAPPEVEP